MNQQSDCEDEIQTQRLADLPLNDEQSETTKAGAGALGGGGGGGGKVSMHDISI